MGKKEKYSKEIQFDKKEDNTAQKEVLKTEKQEQHNKITQENS